MATSASLASLARTDPFRLGPLVVEPAGCRVFAIDMREERLEPRVMQVLVVLAAARGAVVSRDELIETCWDGRIVSDDAINRVIGRLRRVGEMLGGGAFHIETVPKVGYRLVGAVEPWTGPANLAEPVQPGPDVPPLPGTVPESVRSPRRWLWGVAALSAVALVSALLAIRPWEPAGARLEIGRFEGDQLQATLATDLQSELARAIDCDCIPVSATADGVAPSKRQFRLLGRATSAASGLVLMPELYLPGESDPVWRGREELVADAAERKVGVERLATVVSCILGGARDGQMPLKGEALRHWAGYCDAEAKIGANADELIVRLERLLASEPRSALGWEALATQRMEATSGSDPAWRQKALLPAREAVEKAVALAPERRGLLLAQASVTEPEAFAEREELVLKAASDKQDAYAQQALGQHYRKVGRVQEALRAYKLAVKLQPWNELNRLLLYSMQRVAGEHGEAAATLSTLSDPVERARGELAIAVYRGDWAEAAVLARSGPDDRHTQAMLPLLAALEGGDPAAIKAASAPMAALAVDPASNSGTVARMLAVAGRPAEALASIDAAIGPANYPPRLGELWSASFDEVRRLPGFWAMADRRGLLDYWRTNGPPDFCREADAPAPCAELVRPRG